MSYTPASISTVHRPADVARTLWRVGMVAIIVLYLAGVVFGLTLVAEDLAVSGEMFDGIGVVIGGLVAGAAMFAVALSLILLRYERRAPRLPVVISALVPASLSLLVYPPSVSQVAHYHPAAVAALTGWLLLCGFIVINRSPGLLPR